MAIQNNPLRPQPDFAPIQARPVKLPELRLPDLAPIPLPHQSDLKPVPAQGQAEGAINFLETQAAVPKLDFTAQKQIFPEEWQPYVTKLEPPSRTHKNNAVKDLTQAAAKYFDGSLDGVSSVHVVGKMQFGNLNYGGTYHQDKIYIAADGKNEVEKTFHHELSSLLLKSHADKFDKASWLAANPPGFRYEGGSAAAVSSGENGLDFEAERHQMGFLSDYSTSSLEDDFNMYAENLFAGGDDFWRVADTYPEVKAKTDLIVDFYQTIDPRYTESYFRNLSD